MFSVWMGIVHILQTKTFKEGGICILRLVCKGHTTYAVVPALKVDHEIRLTEDSKCNER